jgi:hypothetical protein
MFVVWTVASTKKRAGHRTPTRGRRSKYLAQNNSEIGRPLSVKIGMFGCGKTVKASSQTEARESSDNFRKTIT